MSIWRTSKGRRVDREVRLSFSFNGKTYHGFKGDTLASALLANGVHFVGRSYKYHRPRGIVAAGSEEPNALLGIDLGTGRYDTNTRTKKIEACFTAIKNQVRHSLVIVGREFNIISTPQPR